MAEKKTVPKKKEPKKPATFKERLGNAMIIGAVLGAPTFWVLQTAVNWGTRPSEYRVQLDEIRKLEKQMKNTGKTLPHKSLWKSVFLGSRPGGVAINNISADFKQGRLDKAEKDLDQLYTKFKKAIANNRDLQGRIQEIRKTKSFKERFGTESNRKSWWFIKGPLAGGLVGGIGFSASAGIQRLRTRKERKGNPRRPRRGGRGH